MNFKTLPLSSTGQFSKSFLEYISGNPALREFFQCPPTEAGCLEAAKSRTFSGKSRIVLVDTLNSQYSKLPQSELLKENISGLLLEDVFTVTTGHQLNIFTGPLYFIYKIITTINLAERLTKMSGKKVVPVYWMASEDHDFDEINHFHLFGKKFIWETDQKGAVGRFSLDGFDHIINSLPEHHALFEDAYKEGSSLAGATRCLVNSLFGDYGLVVIDGDNFELKSALKSVMIKDILDQSFEPLVVNATKKLNSIGVDGQIHPRSINFFYIKDGIRERIEKNGGNYAVLNTQIEFNESEIKNEIEDHPERFSPNVVLRPVYQELILPNIGYVGGPAEIIYWLQLKEVFDLIKVSFPVLLPRNFATIVTPAISTRLSKLGMTSVQLFDDYSTIREWYLAKHQEQLFDLSPERVQMNQLLAKAKEKLVQLDGSLSGFAEAQNAGIEKIFDSLEKRGKKAEEQKHETGLKQIESLLDKVFPNGELQERFDNILTYLINQPDLIKNLIQTFDPFCHEMYIVEG